MKDILAIYQQETADAEEGIRGNIPKGLPGYFTDWMLEEPKLQNRHTCYSGDTCVFSFGFYAVESLKNCEVSFAIKYGGLLIINAGSLANNGVNFSIAPGNYRFDFKVDFPVRDARLDVEVTLSSFGKKVDSWVSSTKLTVLDNFGSHLYAGVINPHTQFIIREQAPLQPKPVRHY